MHARAASLLARHLASASAAAESASKDEVEVCEVPDPLATAFVLKAAPELPISPGGSLAGKVLFVTGASRG